MQSARFRHCGRCKSRRQRSIGRQWDQEFSIGGVSDSGFRGESALLEGEPPPPIKNLGLNAGSTCKAKLKLFQVPRDRSGHTTTPVSRSSGQSSGHLEHGGGAEFVGEALPRGRLDFFLLSGFGRWPFHLGRSREDRDC